MRIHHLALCAALAAGCAVHAPTARLESSAAAIRAAERAGAPEVPHAALYLQLAREQASRARMLIKAAGSDNMEAASLLLLRAQADGELALAMAQADKDRVAAAQLVADIKALEETP